MVIFAAAPANAVTMPSGATYIADMPADAAEAMTLAVTVDGDRVVAYGTNGSDEEAWFFGTQRGGRIDMMSMYADRVQATYDGATLTGTLTMNGDGNPHAFTAAAAPAPAGIYTATMDGARASWVVRPDRTITGVMDNSAPGRPQGLRRPGRREPAVPGAGPPDAPGSADAAGPADALRHLEHGHPRQAGDGDPGQRGHAVLSAPIICHWFPSRGRRLWFA